MKDKFKVTCNQAVQLTDSQKYVVVLGGYSGDEIETRVGFISFKIVDEITPDAFVLTGDDPIRIVTGSRSFKTVEIGTNLELFMSGTGMDGKGYAAVVDLSIEDCEIIPVELDENYDSISKMVLLKEDSEDAKYAVIGIGTLPNGMETSIISTISKDFKTTKSIVTKNGDDNVLMPVLIFDAVVDKDSQLYIGGVVAPTDEMNAVGIIFKLNTELEKINSIIFNSETTEAIIIRNLVIQNDILKALCHVITSGEQGVVDKFVDLDLNEIVDAPQVELASLDPVGVEQ